MPGERVKGGMSPSLNDPGRADPTDPGSEQRLLDRVRRGRASAVAALFERYAPWLRRRASGRLPPWARRGVATSDLVQDVLHHTFARLTWFESKHVSALRAYLRRAVENRVQDELRRAIRRLDIAHLAPAEDPLRPFEDAAPQYQQRLQEELWGRYRQGLTRLKVRDRRLIRDFRVSDFRKTIPDPEREPKLDQFAQLIRSGRSDLFNIKELQLRQFSQISFISKILMVLDPTRSPVLDLKIAKAFAKSSFLPLQNLTFAKAGISITKRNATAYDTWACWCREIATVVNEAPVSPCRGVRAVDVERALFTLADSQATDKARVLLDGPAGWTFDRR